MELANAAADCASCDGHAEAQAPALGSLDDDCPCVDLQLPGSQRAPRLSPKTVALQLACIAPAPRIVAEPAFEPRLPRAADAVPRPPDSLALIRSVVLLL